MPVPIHGGFRPPQSWKTHCVLWTCLYALVMTTHAKDAAYDHLVAQGAQAAKTGQIALAVKLYSTAEQSGNVDSTDLCALTKCFCDLMHGTASPQMQKILAEKALACSESAVKANPMNATAHICVAICYAKNFPYADNQTKVYYSRAIKTESEKAIALDPRQDVAYYLLGRWNYGVAGMNFFYRGLVRLVYGGLPAASDAEAIRDLKKAIDLNPDRIIHHAELGKVYLAVGEKEFARHEFEKCARLKPLDLDDADAQAEAAGELSALTK